MSSNMSNWNPNLYDDKINFVSELGKDVVKLLDPKPDEKIIDLGCGTGDLTNEILKLGAVPIGIDNSKSMIDKARQKYPKIQFLIDNGEPFRLNDQFDAVFSNAALHWMTNAEKVVESIWLALRQGGRFVAEFGGKGNVKLITEAVFEVTSEIGINVPDKNIWYYPSIGEYASLLEKQGFRVVYALHFDRPTKLEDGENGLKHWLNMFARTFFDKTSKEQKYKAYAAIEKKLHPYIFKDGFWYADYVRIRIKAIK